MPHNVPPTPPPKKRLNFFKKALSLNESNIQKTVDSLGSSLSSSTSSNGSYASGTVSIHRTSSEHHVSDHSTSSHHHHHTSSSLASSAGTHHHTNGIHNRSHGIPHKASHQSSTSSAHNSSLPTSTTTPTRAASPPKLKPINDNQVTLKQQNRTIGDTYLVNAWKKYQFIDTILYAYSDLDSEGSVPIPAHKILLQNYSGFCQKFFNVYPFTSSALKKGLDSVGESFKNDDNHDFSPSPEMTQLEIQRLSGNQIPILSIPIPFYDLLKLVTLMYVGEVTVEKQNLNSLQRSAVTLKVSIF